jgi:short chain dehydrogenase
MPLKTASSAGFRENGYERKKMNISFEGKVALVTGAASGLGFATAKAFAESGASVVLADLNDKEVQAAAKELADKGFKTLAIRCDVSKDDEVEAMVKQTVAKFDRLDMAYNNAGIQNVLAETADSPRDDYDRVMGGQPARRLELHGVTVSRTNRIFVNFPRWGDDVPFTVAEVIQGKTVAYPDATANDWPGRRSADPSSYQAFSAKPIDVRIYGPSLMPSAQRTVLIRAIRKMSVFGRAELPALPATTRAETFRF